MAVAANTDEATEKTHSHKGDFRLPSVDKPQLNAQLSVYYLTHHEFQVAEVAWQDYQPEFLMLKFKLLKETSRRKGIVFL